MSEPKVFVCPTCGAKLTVRGTETQVECSFCGNTVIVPEELRVQRAAETKPAAEPAATQAAVAAGTTPAATQESSTADNIGLLLGCGGGLIGIIVAIVAVILSLLPQSVQTDLAAMAQGVFGYAHRVSVFGGSGTAAGTFQNAAHVAVDGQGFVYVSEQRTQRIHRFDTTGSYQTTWTVPDANSAPTRIKGAPDGGLFVQTSSTALLRLDGASGKLVKTVRGETYSPGAQYENIRDFAFGRNGEMLAITSGKGSDDLVRFDAGGTVVARIPQIVSAHKTEFISISDLSLATDSAGNFFIMDRSSSEPAIYRYAPDGRYLGRFGAKGKQNDQFYSLSIPFMADGKGRLYMMDFGALKIFDGEGHYLNTIDRSVYGDSVTDFALNASSEIFVLGKDKVYKLALNGSQ